MLAPTSTAERRASIARQSEGFLYYVSLTGITGARLTDLQDVRRNVDKIRRVTSTPIAVGFGIASPADAAQVASIADGVIVGSAIVRRIGDRLQDAALLPQVADFVKVLKDAMRAETSLAQP